ncbi:hypothetical protein QR680_015088 [Steinernema hermaphroditum]|uniref:Receptor ligand binding region domain-containing protein n=1 Tax=Steinernema hermaphroditum TaxID=289476 RepID=A0AA39IB56_9BILA|nr:hypothetical protein QR680_015088 [Steinernema hermaphroditum]
MKYLALFPILLLGYSHTSPVRPTHDESFDGIIKRTKEVIDEEIKASNGDIDMGVLEGKINFMKTTEFTNLNENYGIFIWLEDCPLASNHIAFGNVPSPTVIFPHWNLRVMIHRSYPQGEEAKKSRHYYSKQQGALRDALNVETVGMVFIGVSGESAMNDVNKLRAVHEFGLTAVLIFEQSKRQCTVISDLSTLSTTMTKTVGFPFMYIDTSYQVVAIFGY